MPSMFMGVNLGLTFWNFGTNIYLGVGISMSLTGNCMMAFMAFLLNIPLERALIVREYKNGSYSADAYLAARVTLAAGTSFAIAFATTPIWWFMLGLPLRDPARLLTAAVAVGMNSAVYAVLATIAGVLAPTPVAAAQVAEPIISLLTLTAGVMLTRPQIKVYWKWLWAINPMHYATEVAFVSALQNRHATDKAEDVMDYYHFENGTHVPNLLRLFAIFVVVVAAGFPIINAKFRTL